MTINLEGNHDAIKLVRALRVAIDKTASKK